MKIQEALYQCDRCQEKIPYRQGREVYWNERPIIEENMFSVSKVDFRHLCNACADKLKIGFDLFTKKIVVI